MRLAETPARRSQDLGSAFPARKTEHKLGIILKGSWQCNPETATREELRRFLAIGFHKLGQIADEVRLDEEDRGRLFAKVFRAFSQVEEQIWKNVQAGQAKDEDVSSLADVIQLCDEDAQALKEVCEEQEASARAITEIEWCEEPPLPEGEVSTDLENYSL